MTNFDEPITITLTRAQWDHLSAAARHLRKKRASDAAKRPYVPPAGKRHSGEEQVRSLTTALDIIQGVLSSSDKKAKPCANASSST